MTLSELAQRHGTDKAPRYHGYTEWYEPILAPLRDKPVRILEVGVGRGGSLRMWADYFTSPAATVVGLDRERKPAPPGTVTDVANQASREELRAALARHGSEFDLVIDDGGHRMDEQQITLGVLFPAVRPGGLYVIEDVHTSFPALRAGFGVEADGANSTYALVDRYVRTGRITSPYLTEAECRYLEASVAWCSYTFRPTRRHSDVVLWVKKAARHV